METASFLRNRYWVLRHGKSIPNEKGLIVSSMENGVLAEYQLASEGVDQARLAGELFLKVKQIQTYMDGIDKSSCYNVTLISNEDMQELGEKNIPVESVRICYSPFARTRHTAEVVASVLNLPFEGPQCKVIEDLRERYFGPSFELKSHDKYTDIWALDEKDPFQKPEGGESVDDVVSRLSNAMNIIESEYEG